MQRAFLPEPLDRETVERIARVVRRAPSAGFSQGHGVVVVTDPATRAEIARRCEEDAYVRSGNAPFMSSAPVLIVVWANESAYHARYNEPDKLAAAGGREIHWPVPFWFVDAGAAMMLVLLAAIDEGLGAVFFGHPHEEAFLRELLGLPPEVVPVGIVALGRPAPDPQADEAATRRAARRRPLGEVVHWERWSGSRAP
jgi:nitroreductase